VLQKSVYRSVFLQSRVGGTTWKLLVTCSSTSCVAVCRGRDSKPIRWRNDIRRLVIPSVLLPSTSSAKTRRVSVRIAPSASALCPKKGSLTFFDCNLKKDYQPDWVRWEFERSFGGQLCLEYLSQKVEEEFECGRGLPNGLRHLMCEASKHRFVYRARVVHLLVSAMNIMRITGTCNLRSFL